MSLQGTDCEHLYCQFSRVDIRAYLIVLYNDKMIIFKIFITSSRRLHHQRNQHGVIRGTVGSNFCVTLVFFSLLLETFCY